MSAERFQVVATNPNDDVGGGGCLCSPEKVTDCTGPFVVFYATEAGDSRLSPHQVLGCKCAKAAGIALSGEVAQVGHELWDAEREAQRAETLAAVDALYAPATSGTIAAAAKAATVSSAPTRVPAAVYDFNSDAEEIPVV